MRTLRWAAAMLLSLSLLGCSSLAPATQTPTQTARVVERSADPDLIEARRAAGIADCPASSDTPAVEGGLPEVTLGCLGGGSSMRLAGLRGPMLINLWAQWCPPCRAEAGHLAAFSSIQSEVKVLGIDYGDPDPALAIEFAQLVAAKYPQLADPDEQLKAPLGIPGIPYSLLIDADGKIVARHPGEFTSLEELQGWVGQELAK